MGCKAAGGMTEPPYLEFGSKPLYPIEALGSGKAGCANIQLTVGTDGKIHVTSWKSCDSKWFANHAAIATRDWQVRPATFKGTPVTAQCALSFKYVM